MVIGEAEAVVVVPTPSQAAAVDCHSLVVLALLVQSTLTQARMALSPVADQAERKAVTLVMAARASASCMFGEIDG
jgi:heme exporter protein D